MLHKVYQNGDTVKAKDAPAISLLLKNVSTRIFSACRSKATEYDIESGSTPRKLDLKTQQEKSVFEISSSDVVDDTPTLDNTGNDSLTDALELFPRGSTDKASEFDVPTMSVTGHIVWADPPQRFKIQRAYPKMIGGLLTCSIGEKSGGISISNTWIKGL